VAGRKKKRLPQSKDPFPPSGPIVKLLIREIFFLIWTWLDNRNRVRECLILIYAHDCLHFYFGFERYRFLFSFFGSGEDDYAMAGYYSSQRGYGGSYGSSYGGSSSSAYTSSLRSNYMPVSLPLLGRLKSPQLFSFLRSFFASQPNQKQQKKILFFAVMTKLERRQLKRSEDIRPSFVQRQVLGAKLLENAKVRRISRKGDKRRCVLM
jgi:hypothetical protein